MRSPTPSEASTEGASRPKGKRAVAQRHRFTKDEVRLLAETYREHKHKKLAAQVAIYNAAAKQRGWYDQVKLAAYSARCQCLRREQQFKTEGGAAKEPPMCKTWEAYEDEALTKWDWGGKRYAQYAAFIEHMREAFDPNYFRSIKAIVSRLTILANRKAGDGAQRADVKAEEPTDVTIKVDAEAKYGRASEDMDAEMEDNGGGGFYEPKVWQSSTASGNIARHRTGFHTIAPDPPATVHDRATQTSPAPTVAAEGAISTDEADLCVSDKHPDVVPVNMPTAAQELVERKLRHMQTVSSPMSV